jgi:hypothetical protein
MKSEGRYLDSAQQRPGPHIWAMRRLVGALVKAEHSRMCGNHILGSGAVKVRFICVIAHILLSCCFLHLQLPKSSSCSSTEENAGAVIAKTSTFIIKDSALDS